MSPVMLSPIAGIAAYELKCGLSKVIRRNHRGPIDRRSCAAFRALDLRAALLRTRRTSAAAGARIEAPGLRESNSRPDSNHSSGAGGRIYGEGNQDLSGRLPHGI